MSPVTTAATVGDLTAEEKREGDEDVGSLPRDELYKNRSSGKTDSQ